MTPSPEHRGKLQVCWAVVLGSNLVVPVLFVIGMEVLHAAVPGIVLGVVAVWAVGAFVCRKQPELVDTVCHGGILTALSQVFPFLHAGAGVAGFTWFWLKWHQYGPAGVSVITSFDTFAITILTASFILAVAWTVGWGLGRAS